LFHQFAWDCFLLLIELGWGGMGGMNFFALAMNLNAYLGDVQKDN
jgi:hypothetical protein